MVFVMLQHLQSLKRQDVLYVAHSLYVQIFSELSSLHIDLSVLNAAGHGFTRKERKFSTEPITELNGNVIDTSMPVYLCWL